MLWEISKAARKTKLFGNGKRRTNRAVVVLVTPAFAHWFNETALLSDILTCIFGPGEAREENLEVSLLTAVVDGLPFPTRDRHPAAAEGLAFLIGRDRIIAPGLFTDVWTSQEIDDKAHLLHPQHLIFGLGSQANGENGQAQFIDVMLPLSSTGFRKEVGSALSVSKWRVPRGSSKFELVEAHHKKSQRILLSTAHAPSPISLHSPVVPLGAAYRVRSGFGHSIAKVQHLRGADALSAPAELEYRVKKYLHWTERTGQAISVWALVIPGDLLETCISPDEDGMPKKSMVHLLDNKAIQDLWSSPNEEATDYPAKLIQDGARLHRVQVVEDAFGTKVLELERQALATNVDLPIQILPSLSVPPGSYVQFFADPDMSNYESPHGTIAQQSETLRYTRNLDTQEIGKFKLSYLLGTIPAPATLRHIRAPIGDLDDPEDYATRLRSYNKPRIIHHAFRFGALTQSALYLSTPESSTTSGPTIQTKLSMPFASITQKFQGAVPETHMEQLQRQLMETKMELEQGGEKLRDRVRQVLIKEVERLEKEIKQLESRKSRYQLGRQKREESILEAAKKTLEEPERAWNTGAEVEGTQRAEKKVEEQQGAEGKAGEQQEAEQEAEKGQGAEKGAEVRHGSKKDEQLEHAEKGLGAEKGAEVRHGAKKDEKLEHAEKVAEIRQKAIEVAKERHREEKERKLAATTEAEGDATKTLLVKLALRIEQLEKKVRKPQVLRMERQQLEDRVAGNASRHPSRLNTVDVSRAEHQPPVGASSNVHLGDSGDSSVSSAQHNPDGTMIHTPIGSTLSPGETEDAQHPRDSEDQAVTAKPWDREDAPFKIGWLLMADATDMPLPGEHEPAARDKAPERQKKDSKQSDLAARKQSLDMALAEEVGSEAMDTEHVGSRKEMEEELRLWEEMLKKAAEKYADEKKKWSADIKKEVGKLLGPEAGALRDQIVGLADREKQVVRLLESLRKRKVKDTDERVPDAKKLAASLTRERKQLEVKLDDMNKAAVEPLRAPFLSWKKEQKKLLRQMEKTLQEKWESWRKAVRNNSGGKKLRVCVSNYAQLQHDVSKLEKWMAAPPIDEKTKADYEDLLRKGNAASRREVKQCKAVDEIIETVVNGTLLRPQQFNALCARNLKERRRWAAYSLERSALSPPPGKETEPPIKPNQLLEDITKAVRQVYQSGARRYTPGHSQPVEVANQYKPGDSHLTELALYVRTLLGPDVKVEKLAASRRFIEGRRNGVPQATKLKLPKRYWEDLVALPVWWTGV